MCLNPGSISFDKLMLSHLLLLLLATLTFSFQPQYGFEDHYRVSPNTYDFSYVFEDIKSYISSADIAIGNLETTFAGKERRYSNYPTFNTPEQLATDLKNLGIDKIWVKAKTKAHHTILSHLNINKIIHPEEDMGVRVAQALNYPMVSRYMSLDDDHYIVKIDIPEKLNGINLYGIMQQAPQVKTLLVKRQQQILFETEETFTLQTHDILILEGHLQQLKKLSNCFI